MRIGIVTVSLAAALTTEAAGALFPPEIELSGLLPANGGDGRDGFALSGIAVDDYSGTVVGSAGDINADGLDDLLISATGASPGDREDAGQSYVVFGRAADAEAFPADFELSSLLQVNGGDGSAGFVLNGIDEYDLSGWSIAAAGDVNGDGIDDLMIGARIADPGDREAAGESYVVFGRATGFPAEIDLASLLPGNGGDGSDGFIINGIAAEDRSGSTASGGDVNGDGIDDVITGAPSATDHGECYVVFGRDVSEVGDFSAEFELASLVEANGGDGSAGFVIHGFAVSIGDAAHIGGDVNGDGLRDIVIGDRQAGQTYVLFGRDAADAGGFPPELDLASLLAANGGDGSAGFVLHGAGLYSDLGSSVSTGDINGDGLADVIVGDSDSPRNGDMTQSGMTYVVFGRNALQVGNFPAEIPLDTLLTGDGSVGFVLKGAAAGEFSGTSVDAVPDINGDAIDDLLIGALQADAQGIEVAGAAYVVFGRAAAGFPPVFPLSSLYADSGGDGRSGVVLLGFNAHDLVGSSVSSAGDVNADGIADLIVGAEHADLGAGEDVGQSYVVYGRRDSDGDNLADNADNCTLTANSDQRDTDADGFGNACDADLSNDCVVNFEDLAIMKAAFFSADPDADLNGDGNVNFSDLAVMKATFFLPPGPSGVPNVCADERRNP